MWPPNPLGCTGVRCIVVVRQNEAGMKQLRSLLPAVATLAASVSHNSPPPHPCAKGSKAANLPFCQPSVPLEDRLDDLLTRLSFTEKVTLLGNEAAAVEHLNLPAYQWWSEALHGVAYSPGVKFDDLTPASTAFPQVVTTSHAFNLTLVQAIAVAISDEARAFANVGHAGLTFWAPNINIFRDPRWGRGQETPGEDPLYNGQYAATFVKGMQEGEDPLYLKTSACCKHFDAYSVEAIPNGTDRHSFNAIVTPQDMADTFLPAFKACVMEGKASSLMCSYNEVNGVPSCADQFLLRELARGEWGFDGYITSDCGAVDDIFRPHNYTKTREDTVAAALKAGTDLDCGQFYQHYVPDAIRAGTIAVDDVDTALRNLFRVQFRLGLFDPRDVQSYTKIGLERINTPAHQQLALEAAQQGLVLLKNMNDTLPFSAADLASLAVLGPHASAKDTAFLGNYYGHPATVVSALEGIQRIAKAVMWTPGCELTGDDESGLEQATILAATAQATILFVGISPQQEAEGLDRTSIDLPDIQKHLIDKVTKASKGPVVLVVISGGALDLSAYAKDEKIKAILFAGYAGQSGGTAIADALFGHISPSGKLTQTFYDSSFVQSVKIADMRMRPDVDKDFPGRTYRFYSGTPVYPFGHGLTYTQFSIRSIRCSDVQAAAAGTEQLLHVDSPSVRTGKVVARCCLQVNNTAPGRFQGAVKHTFLAFLAPPANSSVLLKSGTPRHSLRAFGGVVLKAGEAANVELQFGEEDFLLTDCVGMWRHVPGQWSLQVDGYRGVLDLQ